MRAFLVSQLVKNKTNKQKKTACNVGDLGSIPGSGRSLGEGQGNPLQYSCLGNPMNRGAWHPVARVRRDLATKSPMPHK